MKKVNSAEARTLNGGGKCPNGVHRAPSLSKTTKVKHRFHKDTVYHWYCRECGKSYITVFCNG